MSPSTKAGSQSVESPLSGGHFPLMHLCPNVWFVGRNLATTSKVRNDDLEKILTTKTSWGKTQGGFRQN